MKKLVTNSKGFYKLPKLSYSFNALKPIISEEQLKIHYEKHHKVYVDKANEILQKLDALEENKDLDFKCLLKSLSFNVGGHILHSLFWENLSFPNEKNDIDSSFVEIIINNFGSFDEFKKAFTQTAISVEGSGWVALTYCKLTGRLILCQIEKHNVNIYPAFQFLLVLDVWEHAYYLDYKNDRKKFVESFWDIINWREVYRRYKEIS